MKIIILGAGQVGSSLAANLASEANDITIVDLDQQRLALLSERYDLQTVAGVASYPSVLQRAGARDADMVIAVTNSDEVNMLACQVAYTLFHTPTKIARVREAEYLRQSALFAQEALPIDVLISPEQLVTDHIVRLIDFPGALQVLDFAEGRVQMVAIRAAHNGPLPGHTLRELRGQLPNIDFWIVAIFRSGKPLIPEGDTRIEPEDEVFFIAATRQMRALMGLLRDKELGVRRIMLAGGGNIGQRLARALEKKYEVKIVEMDAWRAEQASETLERTVVLLGDAADEELLIDENIDQTDVFCAVTNDDEANIISSMLAKRLGARKVMSLINRASYVDLVQSNIIDIAISPQQSTIGSLLAHIRKGDVVVVHSLRRGAAEAIEAVAHGDVNSSQVVGRRLDQIELPPETSIGAIVRGDEVIIAHPEAVIEADDHLVMLVANKSRVPEVERLFQVGITFL